MFVGLCVGCVEKLLFVVEWWDVIEWIDVWVGECVFDWDEG